MDNRKNLGWMNGWPMGGEKYALIERCYKLGHHTQSHNNERRCITTVTCDQCNYVYQIDSSG